MFTFFLCIWYWAEFAFIILLDFLRGYIYRILSRGYITIFLYIWGLTFSTEQGLHVLFSSVFERLNFQNTEQRLHYNFPVYLRG